MKQKNIKKIVVFLLLAILLAIPNSASAQFENVDDGSRQFDPGERQRENERINNPCKISNDDGESVPDTFPVDCLSSPGQNNHVPEDTNIVNQPGTGVIEGRAPITELLLRVVNLIVRFLGALALVIFMLGALLTIVSEGKDDRIEKGKNAMVYSLIGLVIAFMAFIIVAFVQSLLF